MRDKATPQMTLPSKSARDPEQRIPSLPKACPRLDSGTHAGSPTTQAPAFSRHHSPELCWTPYPRKDSRGRRECRVLAATHGPPAAKKAGGRYHRSSRIIRHSLRDGFNAYSGLSLGTGLCCPHRLASSCETWPQRREARTTRLRVRVDAARLASSPRPSQPASTLVTTAIRPSWRGGMGDK